MKTVSGRLSCRVFPWLVSAIGLGLLSACGGGGGGDSGQTQTAPQTTISGTLTDAGTGSAVAGAEVSVGTNDSTTPLSTTTDGTGKYSLTIDTSKINTNTTIVVTVSAPGYQTSTVELQDLSPTGGTVGGGTTMQQAAAGEYYPADGIHLLRLGDGVTVGSVNSKLQTGGGPFPTSKTISFGPVPDAAALGSYSTFKVHVDIRGLEASYCQDSVTVFQGPSDGSANVYQIEWLGGNMQDSAIDGSMTPYTFAVPVNALTPGGGDLNVRISSGNCAGSIAPDLVDDFEFVNVHARFE